MQSPHCIEVESPPDFRAVREITDDIERGLRNNPRRTFEILNPRPV
ncbi:hypothetical protein [Candidatus Binatus sp.]